MIDVAEARHLEESVVSGRRFDVADVVEVLVLWQAGHSARNIARRLGMGRDRIRAILQRAQSAGHAPRDEPLSRQEWQECVAGLFYERTVPVRTAQRTELERFREAIEQGLRTESAAAVWRRLRDEHGINVALRTFRRFARDLVGDVDGRAFGRSLSTELSAARLRIRELEDELALRRTKSHRPALTAQTQDVRAAS